MSTESTIERFIIDEIMIGQKQKTIAPDQSLLESGILDSLALLRLIGFVEDQFGIVVGDADVVPENFESLEAISAYVATKREV